MGLLREKNAPSAWVSGSGERQQPAKRLREQLREHAVGLRGQIAATFGERRGPAHTLFTIGDLIVDLTATLPGRVALATVASTCAWLLLAG